MILGIDATNIRDGGGITHLREFLRSSASVSHSFQRMILWAPDATLRQVGDHEWLEKQSNPVFDRNCLRRAWWQRTSLSAAAKHEQCSVLFCPGGSINCNFRPAVTMSRNLLPYEFKETMRYGFGFAAFKQVLLRVVQSRSYRKADGVIFLTEYARNAVTQVTGNLTGQTTLIPHGVDLRFFSVPRKQSDIGQSTFEEPFRIVYISKVEPYKHQDKVAAAIAQLRSEGLPIVLDLVGPGAGAWQRKLDVTLNLLDPDRKFIRQIGSIPHSELAGIYSKADLCVFASTCENMPNILLESMAAGLPIACSIYGPMPEMLGNNGEFFDPLDSESIAKSVRNLIHSPSRREQVSRDAFHRAQQYSWDRCAAETLSFLAQCAEQNKG